MNKDLLFLSYASEDRVFAEWLERKLVALGYAVWRDKSRMLGGESWPLEIEQALDMSFRVLAVMSIHSIKKQPPLGERTKAQRIGSTRSIDDFLIPLRYDATDPDWMTGIKATIDFQNGWIHGLRQLVKKLESLNTPRGVIDGAHRAVVSFQPEQYLRNEPERLLVNVVEVAGVCEHLREYWLPLEEDAEWRDALADQWAFYPYTSGWRRVLALGPPPDGVPVIEPGKNEWIWPGVNEIGGINTGNIITALVKKSMQVRLLRLGFKRHPNPRKADVLYLEPSFTKNGRLPYADHTGPRIAKKIQGFKSFGPKYAKYKVYHNLAVRVGLAPGLDDRYRILLAPTLHLFHEDGSPIVDKQVNTKRKAITRSWHNDEWLDRFLCMAHVLLSTQDKCTDGIELSPDPVWLDSPVSIDEAALEPVPDDVDGADVEEEGIQVHDDEMDGSYSDEH